MAKEVFEVLFREDTDPVSYVEEKGLSMVQDEGALRSTIEEIVKNNPQSVEDYKNERRKPSDSWWTDHEGNEGKGRPCYGQPDSYANLKLIFIEKLWSNPEKYGRVVVQKIKRL